MITITNTQRSFFINESLIEEQVQAMLEELGYPSFDVGILFCGKVGMRKYNKQFKNKDNPTDILSFPYDETRRPDIPFKVNTPDDENLGDIIICPEYVARKSREWQRSYPEHLVALLAHGVAHLLGHDHHTDEEHERMEDLEARLVKVATCLPSH